MSKGDKETPLVNFSLFRRPRVVPNASDATRLSRNTGCPTGKFNDNESSAPSDHVQSTAIGSNRIANQTKKQCLKRKKEFAAAIAEPADHRLPDQQSVAFDRRVVRKGNTHKRQVQDMEVDDEKRAQISAKTHSHGSSDHHKSEYEDPENLESQSDDFDDESDATMTEEAGTRRKTSKRKRSAQVRNGSKKRQREKINKKMRELRELMPCSKKADKASMLDEAIQYLKTLQLQIQMMSMGMPPMMLPLGLRQMTAPSLPHFAYMGMASLSPVGAPTHFLQSPIPAVSPLTAFVGGGYIRGFPAPNQLQAPPTNFVPTQQCQSTESIPLPPDSKSKPIQKSASLSSINVLMAGTNQEQAKNANAQNRSVPICSQIPSIDFIRFQAQNQPQASPMTFLPPQQFYSTPSIPLPPDSKPNPIQKSASLSSINVLMTSTNQE